MPEPNQQDTSKKLPERSCLSCHFFIGANTWDRVGNPQRQTFSMDLREKLFTASQKPSDGPLWQSLDQLVWIGCAQNVWTEETTYDYITRINTYKEIPKERGPHECYFIPYQKSMGLDTAKDLWQRQYDTARDLAARELEAKREAREIAAYAEQTKIELLVQAREDRKYLEDRKFAASQEELTKANLRWARIITIATIAAAIATAAQVYLQFTRPVP